MRGARPGRATAVAAAIAAVVLAATMPGLACAGDDAGSIDAVQDAEDEVAAEVEAAPPVELWTGPVVDAPATFASPEVAEDLDPAEGVLHARLTAEEVRVAAADGTLEVAYAYNRQIPGPTLRARVGDTLRVDLDNRLEGPTTIHWHGVHVPWAMDGAAWMQDPVEAGATATYEFELNRAGTFWYHPHVDTERQVDLGLYGVLIVEDPAQPVADADLVLVFDTTGETQHEDAADVGFTLHDHGHSRYVAPNDFLVNGVSGATAPLPAGSSARVRLLNVSNAGYVDVRWPGMRQIAADQGLFEALEEPERIVLAPGDRAEAVWLVGADPFDVTLHPWTLAGGAALGEPAVALTVVPDGVEPPPAPLAWSFGGLQPTPDPGQTDILYVFTGSAESANWRINGEVFPDITIEEVTLGATVVIEVRNLSPSEHPFHLHGHAFEFLSVNGEPAPARRVEDTVNVGVHETVRLLLTADNPGDWMTHCHILPHVSGGMMTVLRVSPL